MLQGSNTDFGLLGKFAWEKDHNCVEKPFDINSLKSLLYESSSLPYLFIIVWMFPKTVPAYEVKASGYSYKPNVWRKAHALFIFSFAVHLLIGKSWAKIS